VQGRSVVATSPDTLLPLMKSTVEPVDAADGNEGRTLVKLSVEVDEAEFDRDIDAAFRKIAREVRIPGFRPGKAPRRILEARLGTAPAREQALRDAIPQYLARAVREHDVDIIATPDVDIKGGQDDGPVTFDATVEVRPQVFVPGYAGLRVELPAVEVSDEEIDARIEAERRSHGELNDVDRPAARGDFVTVDLAAERDGEPVPGLNAEDWLYEVGRGWVADGFDEQLIGATAGDQLSFEANPTGTEEPADFTVEVKKVQELVLPDLDDEWVSEHLGEFDTVGQWRDDVRRRMQDVRIGQARQMLVERTSGALAELVDEDPPEALVNNEFQSRAEGFVMQLQAQGIGLEQYLDATGQDQVMLTEGLKDAAARAVKIDLALRAVGDAEDLQVDDDDLTEEYERIATRVNQKPAQVRRAYEKGDAVPELRAELRKRKAVEWLLQHVEIVDGEGRTIERSLLIPDDEIAAVADDAVPSEAGAAVDDEDQTENLE
jgi:trigger factor